MQFVMYKSLGGIVATGELSISGDAVVVAASSSGSAKESMVKLVVHEQCMNRSVQAVSN